jgi:hypothetical protein
VVEDFEDIELFDERSKRSEIDPELIALAAVVRAEGGTQLGTFYTYEQP